MKNKIFILLRVAISFGLLGLLFWLMRDEIRDVLRILAGSRAPLIFAGAALILVNVTILACRLRAIFQGENLELSLKDALQLTFVGYFFNNFMPTAVGGDIIKAHYVSKTNNQRTKSYASVFMDRLIGLYTFLIIAVAALVAVGGNSHLTVVRPMILAFLGVGAFGFVLIISKNVARGMESFLAKIKMFRLGERLHKVYRIVHDYRNRPGVVARSVLISISSQCVYFTVTYLFFLSIGARVDITSIFLIMPVVIFISMVPSIGGLGIREGAIVMFFAPLAGKEMAFAVSMLLLGMLFMISIIGGLIYLWWGVSGIRAAKAGT